jgi:hypothetical protein
MNMIRFPVGDILALFIPGVVTLVRLATLCGLRFVVAESAWFDITF